MLTRVSCQIFRSDLVWCICIFRPRQSIEFSYHVCLIMECCQYSLFDFKLARLIIITLQNKFFIDDLHKDYSKFLFGSISFKSYQWAEIKVLQSTIEVLVNLKVSFRAAIRCD